MTMHSRLLILSKFPKLSWATFVGIFDLVQLMGGLLGVPSGIESCLEGPRTCSKQVSWDTQESVSLGQKAEWPGKVVAGAFAEPLGGGGRAAEAGRLRIL